MQAIEREAEAASRERKLQMARRVEAEGQRRRAEQARALEQEAAIGRRRGGRAFLDSLHNNTALKIESSDLERR